MINLIDKPGRQTNLIAVGTVSLRCAGHDLALRKLAGKRVRKGNGWIGCPRHAHCLMGAAPRKNVIRENSDPGDIIILMGGRTGRDGCGGATGSSKAHTTESSSSAKESIASTSFLSTTIAILSCDSEIASSVPSSPAYFLGPCLPI